MPRRIYSEAVREALIVLWEAADRICGKRLKAILPGLISALERNGHLAVDPIVRQHLLAVSLATIDRLLRRSAGQQVDAGSASRLRSPAGKFPSGPSQTGRSRNLGSSRWTSLPTAATPCRGPSCGAWWRPMCVRGGPRRSLWWPGSSFWSSKGLQSCDVSSRCRSAGSTRTMTAPSSTRHSRAIARNSISSSRARGPIRRTIKPGSSRRMAR